MIALAEEADINPTWLLLGDGPEFRGTAVSGQELGASLRAHVSRSLAAELQVSHDFVEAVLPAAEELLEGLLQRHRPTIALEVEAKRKFDRSKSPLSRALALIKRDGNRAGVRGLEKSLTAWLTAEETRLAALPPLEPAGTHDLGPPSPIAPLEVTQ